MFNKLPNKRILAAATTGGVVAITTLLGAGVCAADSNWTITVKNGSKVPADVTLFYESRAVGSKATAVRPDGGTATISIPSTSPANKSKYSWKAEYGGKVCGSRSVDISGPATVIVTCDAAPPASSSSQSKPAAIPNLRLKSPAELEKEIEDAEKDLRAVDEELNKVDSKDELEKLKTRADKDRDTINRVKTILNGPQRSVIETNPSDWTIVTQKTTDVGARVEAVEKRILGCVLTGDATKSDSKGGNATPAPKIDSGTKGKHVAGCKKQF